jgi:hypothetical protein
VVHQQVPHPSRLPENFPRRWELSTTYLFESSGSDTFIVIGCMHLVVTVIANHSNFFQQILILHQSNVCLSEPCMAIKGIL